MESQPVTCSSAPINCLEELLSQYEQDDIIMCGDWNTSFERDTCQTQFMTAFMDRNDLRLSWHHPMANKSNIILM